MKWFRWVLFGQEPGPAQLDPLSALSVSAEVVVPLLRPDGTEKPIGRLLRGVEYTEARDLVFRFDGFIVTIKGDFSVLTEESDM